ncbi:MAG: 4-hydroxy-tetrahydrodipicolinate reductase [Flavobacterium sp.]
MKIALLGYGKMGLAIEKIAVERGHEIVLRKRKDDTYDGLEQAHVAIDFSVPDAAVPHLKKALTTGIPVISGTTGWLKKYNDIVDLCQKENGAFLYASNFSLGVNLFFELNSHLAKLMATHANYDVAMEEIHHTQKLDAPSGTAITIANGIIENSHYKQWTLDEPTLSEDLKINVKRIDHVPGTHVVSYTSEIDTIEIKHTAHSRIGFALGAIIAAEWIVNKKGIYTMKDVLGLY